MKSVVRPEIHAGHIEVAVATLIGWRRHTIVPNVSWGLNLRHECDLLILDDKGRFTEVEIKVTRSDLKADLKKTHGHSSKIISRLIFAVPHELLEFSLDVIPSRAGLITVKWDHYGGRFEAQWQRRCRHCKHFEKTGPETVLKFMSLGCMRIWSLKEHNYNRMALLKTAEK